MDRLVDNLSDMQTALYKCILKEILLATSSQ